uniref:Large ribosomal subunit protein bL35m n=1 Tax=Anas platyrhynchos platyrhynchos TaxID=8840 RepID=A0A493SW98_ANAPP
MAAALRGALAGLLRPLGSWAPRAARGVGAGRGVPLRGFRWLREAPPTLGKGLGPLGSLPAGGFPSVLGRVTPLLPTILQQPVRTVTYYSLRKGKRKTVKAVIDRFLRLHNGLWVRRKSGYKKKLWKKSAAQKKRLREMVLCTRTQCKLLDKMTTSFWKRRNWKEVVSCVVWPLYLNFRS